MKLEDMIMVVENRGGTETNYLLDLTDYMGKALELWGEHAEDMAGAVSTLYGTKEGKTDWSDLYFTADNSIRAAFCSSEPQLRGFLMGNFNDGEWSFDEGRCSGECLDVLRIYNIATDGRLQFPYLHYEPVERTFHAGELLHNMNGSDYRVLAALSPKNLLLQGQRDGQFIVGLGVRLYERYPVGERPDGDSMVTGIEWDHGVYLGNDITRLDFDILKQEYGEREPEWAEDIKSLRDKVWKDFRMQKNVEQKEALPARVREAAKSCLEHTFGTSDSEVFDTMLEKGLYDRMYRVKNEEKKISGQSR